MEIKHPKRERQRDSRKSTVKEIKLPPRSCRWSWIVLIAIYVIKNQLSIF